MHFTGDISAGTISIIITLVVLALRLGWQIGSIQTTTKSHADLLQRHTERLDTYERSLVDVVGDVQRLIGRIEATQDRIERHTGHRAGEQGS